MSEKIYLVVSEEWYGGDCVKAFNTATAKEDAEQYIEECVQATGGKVDFILKQIDLVLQ
jgi:hypothetical protein